MCVCVRERESVRGRETCFGSSVEEEDIVARVEAVPKRTHEVRAVCLNVACTV